MCEFKRAHVGISLSNAHTHSIKGQNPGFHTSIQLQWTYPQEYKFLYLRVTDPNGQLDLLPRKHWSAGYQCSPGLSHPSIQVQNSIKNTCSGQYFSGELVQIPHQSNWWPWINHSSHLCAEWEKTSQQLMHAKAFGGDGWRHYGAFRQWHAIRENHFIE